jgi:hypothetical protein
MAITLHLLKQYFLIENFSKIFEFGEFEKSKRQCEAHYEFQGYHRS